MARLERSIPARLNRRVCLGCGYDGRLIQGRRSDGAPNRGGSIYQCPKCKADLYARPPRSYAEMEGFDSSPHTAPMTVIVERVIEVRHAAPRTPPALLRTIERTLLIGLSLFFIVVVGAYSAAAFGVPI